jgi:hypothetical protein
MSRGPGRVERAFAGLLNTSPFSDPHADGLGPVGITVAEAAKLIFATDQPTVAQKSSVHRARLRLVERGDAIDILHGGPVIIPRREHWYRSERPIGRPRTPQEQAAFDAHAERGRQEAEQIMNRLAAEGQGRKITMSDIRAGDSVTLRGSDPPKTGHVLTILYRSADWLPGDFPAGQVPDVLAVVAWKGGTSPVAERPEDLIHTAQ